MLGTKWRALLRVVVGGVALLALVMVSGGATVNVNNCVTGDPEPLLAVTVMG